MESGPVFTFGLGTVNELGNSNRSVFSKQKSEIIPFRVRLPPCKEVAAGGMFSMCLATDGKVIAFGESGRGRKGTSEDGIVQLRLSVQVKHIACGYWHSLFIDEAQFVWGTGNNKHGELGLGDTSNRAEFTRSAVQAQHISGGGYFSLCIRLDGKAMGTGCAEHCGLGRATTVFAELPMPHPCSNLDAGYRHSGAVVEGILFMWGNNTDGQLGINSRRDAPQPVQVPNLEQVVQVSCTKGLKHSHSGCVDSQRNVFMWGSGYKGKLGLDSSWSHKHPADRLTPELIKDFHADVLECGGIHSAAISEGELFTWGCGSDGRLGHPEVEGHRYLYKEALPRAVSLGRPVRQISSSYYFNIILTG